MHPDDRNAGATRFVDDLRRAAGAARGLPVPDGDQQVRVPKDDSARLEIRGGRRPVTISCVAERLELEHGIRRVEQLVEFADRFRKITRVLVARKRQWALQRETELPRPFGDHAIGAFRERGHHAQQWRGVVEEGILSPRRFSVMGVRDGLLDDLEHAIDRPLDRRTVPVRFGDTVPGHADGNDETRPRRMAARPLGVEPTARRTFAASTGRVFAFQRKSR